MIFGNKAPLKQYVNVIETFGANSIETINILNESPKWFLRKILTLSIIEFIFRIIYDEEERPKASALFLNPKVVDYLHKRKRAKTLNSLELILSNGQDDLFLQTLMTKTSNELEEPLLFAINAILKGEELPFNEINKKAHLISLKLNQIDLKQSTINHLITSFKNGVQNGN